METVQIHTANFLKEGLIITGTGGRPYPTQKLTSVTLAEPSDRDPGECTGYLFLVAGMHGGSAR
jgi:hypothetical protein